MATPARLPSGSIGTTCTALSCFTELNSGVLSYKRTQQVTVRGPIVRLTSQPETDGLSSVRFAITATDRYLEVFKTLVEHGWTPVKLFTAPVDNRLHRNTAVLDFAKQLNVEVQISRLTDDNLRGLADRGCEVLVVASYAWRIGDWRPHLRYAVNFHPSPLPHGRGPYPAPAAILEQSKTWGVSCHKLDHDFDSGDVLKSDEFPLTPDEDHDSLDLKIQLAVRRLSADVAGRFEEYWQRARPQQGGDYYPMWTDADRRLDFTQDVADVLRRMRAFGAVPSSRRRAEHGARRLDRRVVIVISLICYRSSARPPMMNGFQVLQR
jgi:methionyl-tRNA formyltransferase